MLNYTFSKTVDDCVYSIDMLYIRGYCTRSLNYYNDYLSSLCPESNHKTYKGRSKHSYFQDVYVIDGMDIKCGYFNEFDAIKRTWSVISLAEIRFNPNKCVSASHKMLISWFCGCTESRWISKFDFACDVPCSTSDLLVKSNRICDSYHNGQTRYYGSVYSDIRFKIYDKRFEYNRSASDDDKILNPLTRIEMTMKTSKLDTDIEERFYRVNNIADLVSESDGLNDTDIAILQAFSRLTVYEPFLKLSDFKLGRKKQEKLKTYLSSTSLDSRSLLLVSFDNKLVKDLLGMVSSEYDCTLSAIRKQLLNDSDGHGNDTDDSFGFVQGIDDLPF